MKSVLTVVFIIAIISTFKYLIKNQVLDFLGASSGVYMIILFILAVLFALKNLDYIDSQTVSAFLFILFFVLISPSLWGFINSDRASDTIDTGMTDLQTTAKNGHFKDSILAFITGQKMKGSGDYLRNADTEQTHEYIGVKIEGIEPFKEEFYSTEPVYIDIDYSANSYFPIRVITGCKIDKIGYGTVDKPTALVSKSQPLRVRCTFNNLPKGSYSVDFISIYSFESTVRVPLKFMEKEFVNTLLQLSKDSGNSLTAESYVGGTQNPLTSAGPIAIGASNTKKDGVNVLKMPIELSRENINENSPVIKLQIQQEDITGKIAKINEASFNLPAGMYLDNCDFLSQQMDENSYEEDKGRWIYKINSDFSSWGENLKTLSCNIKFDKSNVNTFLPPQMRWSPQTIIFSMKYEFKLEKAISIKVVS